MQIGWSDARIEAGMAAQMRRLAEAERAGQRVLGWKVGFGAPAALARLDLRAPLVGYLLAGARLPSGATIDVGGWVRPVIEPEIALYLGADLSGGESRAATLAAIAAVGPAIELADLDQPPEDAAAILAGDIYQRHVIAGVPRPVPARASSPLAGLRATIRRNGAPIADGPDLTALTGDPLDIVAHVAATLARCGRRLAAGELIIAGSVIAPLMGGAGERVDYALAPFEELSVTLA